MATLLVEGSDVVVRLTTMEKLGALHGDVRVPRQAVRHVDVTTTPFSQLRGVRAPGTGVPGYVALGTWRRRGGKKDFVAVYRGRAAVIVDLDGNQCAFERLVVSADDADEIVRVLTEA